MNCSYCYGPCRCPEFRVRYWKHRLKLRAETRQRLECLGRNLAAAGMAEQVHRTSFAAGAALGHWFAG